MNVKMKMKTKRERERELKSKVCRLTVVFIIQKKGAGLIHNGK